MEIYKKMYLINENKFVLQKDELTFLINLELLEKYKLHFHMGITANVNFHILQKN